MGRSKAQDRLQAKIEELYPCASVADEVYIGELVEERGYTLDEMGRELGHKPHKMFVDIVMRESDRTVAFEYHGEQHYSVVGNMVKTTADLVVEQQRDQEKSWILSRIGVPLVAVPFDMYVDEAVLEAAIDDASDECSAAASVLSECPSCQRKFPSKEMPDGICKACSENESEQREQDTAEEKRELRQKNREKNRRMRAKRQQVVELEAEPDGYGMYDYEYPDAEDYSEEERADSWKKAQKERAKQLRKTRYQEYKASPEYHAMKEEQKRRRKELYRKQKAERKKR